MMEAPTCRASSFMRPKPHITSSLLTFAPGARRVPGRPKSFLVFGHVSLLRFRRHHVIVDDVCAGRPPRPRPPKVVPSIRACVVIVRQEASCARR